MSGAQAQAADQGACCTSALVRPASASRFLPLCICEQARHKLRHRANHPVCAAAVARPALHAQVTGGSHGLQPLVISGPLTGQHAASEVCCTAVMSVNFFRDSIRELRLKQGGMSAAMLYVYQVQSPHPAWCCTACLIP